MESLKVLLVNGSPHKEGCVYTVLSEIAGTLKEEGIQSEIFWVGNQPMAGCIGCGSCIGKRNCFRKDTVNDFTALIDKYDGFIFGTPVHYAGASGFMTSFMDRVFLLMNSMGNIWPVNRRQPLQPADVAVVRQLLTS